MGRNQRHGYTLGNATCDCTSYPRIGCLLEMTPSSASITIRCFSPHPNRTRISMMTHSILIEESDEEEEEEEIIKIYQQL